LTIYGFCFIPEVNYQGIIMPIRIIKVVLTQNERNRLESIVNSSKTTQYDKQKAQVLLLTDVGEYGSKIAPKDVATRLKISPRSVGRIKEAYARNLSIEDVFQFSGLSNQAKTDSIRTRALKPLKKNAKYIQIDENEGESFLIEHIKCRVTLTKEERRKLEALINEGKQSNRKFNRAKILLLADEGTEGPAMTDEEITKKLDTSLSSVARVRRLLIIKGNVDEVLNFNHRKAGRAPKIDGTIQATLVAQACSQPPEGRCRWTVRLLADRLVELGIVDAISHTAVGTALKKMNLNLGSGRNG
jgi:hypothetical protein